MQYGPVTRAAQRLTTLLTGNSCSLDRLMAVVATVAPDPPDEEEIVSEIDRLASGLQPGPGHDAGPEAVMAYVHGELGFVGNAADYYSPSNSLVHRVLRYRRGIPLTLAAVGVEIGRRVGVELSIVGLPGHVIVGDGHRPTRWFDPFAGGARLELDDCRRLFGRFHPIESFTPDMVEPIDATATTVRMLSNLKLAYRRLGDLSQMAKVLELAVGVPGAAVVERFELATVLAALGRSDQAAEQHEVLAEVDPERAEAHLASARRHRARRN